MVERGKVIPHSCTGFEEAGAASWRLVPNYLDCKSKAAACVAAPTASEGNAPCAQSLFWLTIRKEDGSSSLTPIGLDYVEGQCLRPRCKMFDQQNLVIRGLPTYTGSSGVARRARHNFTKKHPNLSAAVRGTPGHAARGSFAREESRRRVARGLVPEATVVPLTVPPKGAEGEAGDSEEGNFRDEQVKKEEKASSSSRATRKRQKKKSNASQQAVHRREETGDGEEEEHNSQGNWSSTSSSLGEQWGLCGNKAGDERQETPLGP
eukprot:s826_g2.t1